MDTARGNPTILVKHCILCRMPLRTKLLWRSELVSLMASSVYVENIFTVAVTHRHGWRRLLMGLASVLFGMDFDAPSWRLTDSQCPLTPSAPSADADAVIVGFLVRGSSLLPATLSVKMLISWSLMPSF